MKMSSLGLWLMASMMVVQAGQYAKAEGHWSTSSEAEGLSDAILSSHEEELLVEDVVSRNERPASLFSALRKYRKYKKENLGKVRNWKKKVALFKAELKDQNSNLHQAAKIAKTMCQQDRETCEQAWNRLVAPQVAIIMQDDSYSWLDYFIPNAKADSDDVLTCSGGGVQVLLYGSQKLDCDSGYAKTNAEIRTFGPGLAFAPNVWALIMCSGDVKGGFRGNVLHNYGVTVGVGALAGVQFGTYFGESGVCMMLGASLSAGAYAGVSQMVLD